MNDAKRAGENAESKPFNLRLPHPVAAQLDALAASLPIVSKHRLAVEALRLGIAALMADPSILLRGATTPSTSAPATPGAPAPSPAVASPVVPVAAPPVAPVAPVADSRQLPLLAPVVPVTLHTAADGHLSVATPTGNDNAREPATPKPERERARTRPVDAATLDALKTRLADAVAAGQTVKSVAAVAGVNDSGLIQWRKGATGLGPTVAGKLDAALSKLGF